MSLTALKGKKTRKKNARAKARTGLAGVPVDKGFNAVRDYFHLQVDRKDCIQQVKTWIKNNFPLKETNNGKYILANPDYHFSMTHHAAAAFWYNNDLYKNNDLGGNLASEFLNALSKAVSIRSVS